MSVMDYFEWAAHVVFVTERSEKLRAAIGPLISEISSLMIKFCRYLQ